MKPTWRPSGEKNGLSPPSVPASGVGWTWPASLIQRRVVPSPFPTYTIRFPSGEMATRPASAVEDTACSVLKAMA